MKNIDTDEVYKRIKGDVEANQLVVFAGAGVSRTAPSNAPLFKELRNGLISALIRKLYDYTSDEFWSTEYNPSPEFMEGLEQLALRADKHQGIRPEIILQILHEELGDSFRDCLEVLRIGTANCNHLFISQLAAKSSRLILTTNFDSYFENALAALKLRSINCLYDHEMAEQWQRKKSGDLGSDEVIIWHVHGGVDQPISIQTTLTAVGQGRFSTLRWQILTEIMTQYPMLVVGYSANDDDVAPIIWSAGIEKTGKFLYWNTLHMLNPSDPAYDVLQAWADNRQVALIGNMKDFWTNFDIFTGVDPTPVQQSAGEYAERIEMRWRKGWISWASNYLPHQIASVLSVYLFRLQEYEWSHVLARYVLGKAVDGNDFKVASHAAILFADIFRHRGDLNSALEWYKKAALSYSHINDRRGHSHALMGQGTTLTELARYEEAEEVFNHCLATSHSDHYLETKALIGLGNLSIKRGELQNARKALDNALKISRQIGALKMESHALHGLGSVEMLCNNGEQAKSRFLQSLSIRRKIRDMPGQGYSLFQLGTLEVRRKRLKSAQKLMNEALAIFKSVKESKAEADTLIELGRLSRHIGQTEEAQSYFDMALRIYEAKGLLSSEELEKLLEMIS